MFVIHLGCKSLCEHLPLLVIVLNNMLKISSKYDFCCYSNYQNYVPVLSRDQIDLAIN